MADNASSLPGPDPAPTSTGSSPVAAPVRWNSEELLQGTKEVLIQHGPEIYRLRLTRQGKLILYK